MYHIHKHKDTNTNKAGFSLIELLVALAIFLTVITISVSSLLSLINANRKAQSLQSVMNNLNFALDGMLRNISTGRGYYCHPGIGDTALPDATQDCVDGDTDLVLTNDRNDRIAYRFNSAENSIERRIEDEDWISLTASEIVITDMLFYVDGSSRSDTEQPMVTVSIIGEVEQVRTLGATFEIQTTITKRIADF